MGGGGRATARLPPRKLNVPHGTACATAHKLPELSFGTPPAGQPKSSYPAEDEFRWLKSADAPHETTENNESSDPQTRKFLYVVEKVPFRQVPFANFANVPHETQENSKAPIGQAKVPIPKTQSSDGENVRMSHTKHPKTTKVPIRTRTKFLCAA